MREPNSGKDIITCIIKVNIIINIKNRNKKIVPFLSVVFWPLANSFVVHHRHHSVWSVDQAMDTPSMWQECAKRAYVYMHLTHGVHTWLSLPDTSACTQVRRGVVRNVYEMQILRIWHQAFSFFFYSSIPTFDSLTVIIFQPGTNRDYSFLLHV